MITDIMQPEYMALVAMGILYGLMQGRARYLAKKRRDEERELLRWQHELEEKSSQLRK